MHVTAFACWLAPLGETRVARCVSKLPQVIQNFRQGHTGQLALLTVALSFGGNLARVATTVRAGQRSEQELPTLRWHAGKCQTSAGVPQNRIPGSLRR